MVAVSMGAVVITIAALVVVAPSLVVSNLVDGAGSAVGCRRYVGITN